MSDDASIMGTREDAERRLIQQVAVWNGLRQPLMAPAAVHRKIDRYEHEARFQVCQAAVLLAWHLNGGEAPIEMPDYQQLAARARTKEQGA